MIQTIIFLSITTITFMVLFIVTYKKYRKLELQYYFEWVDKYREDLAYEINQREKLQKRLDNPFGGIYEMTPISFTNKED